MIGFSHKCHKLWQLFSCIGMKNILNQMDYYLAMMYDEPGGPVIHWCHKLKDCIVHSLSEGVFNTVTLVI